MVDLVLVVVLALEMGRDGPRDAAFRVLLRSSQKPELTFAASYAVANREP
jgi:hypothetical protein